MYRRGAAYWLRCGRWHGTAETTEPVRLGIRGASLRDALPRGAGVVDLSDCEVMPGFVNAHDHLELNHYPRTKYKMIYPNAHQWGEDVNARLHLPPFADLRALPVWDRCLVGGIKNLLCGVTSVVQHGKPYPALWHRQYPVRVLRRYSFSHSLHFEAHSAVQRSHQHTHSATPWFIHLAEGTDAVATDEYRQLGALGCATPKTVLVHGLGMDDAALQDAATRVRGLILCPSTNHYLLGKTPVLRRYLDQMPPEKVGLGSDSRLTADGDFLQECRALMPEVPPVITARRFCGVNAHIAGIDCRTYADMVAVRQPVTSRADLALVICRGVPMIGDPDIMERLTDFDTVRVTLDDKPKRIHITLANLLQRCAWHEPGIRWHWT